MKKQILMIGTGGTIACKRTEEGLTPAITTEELIGYIPDVKKVCDVHTLQVCNVDSTNMTLHHWKLISRTIEENYEKYDGFVVCHGTDTLAYTAAALSYMIQNSRKPVVITGAQKPINEENTDARTNLLDSFIYASDEESHNVNIVFDGKVIVGTRAKKERAKSYNAFSSINFPYLAVIRGQEILRYIPEEEYVEDVQFFHEMSDSIYVLKLIPGLDPEVLTYLFGKYKCIMIESYGVGGIPEYLTQKFYEVMEGCREQGRLAIVATQVAREGSDMTVYEVGKKVKQDLDLLETYDMTLEAAMTKAMWLMARSDMDYEEMKTEFYRTVNHDILGYRKKKN
ncbi:asparaginase [Muricomes intestini]|jgi:L-asparaginase|uniref:asparaginase n=1 Tax=Muricomes intestini TaxID=1796634 RepID=A0A4R3K265_9FIRM|nr:asparaginase [Muricomes intestini]TCS76193.1 L-asparaginase [Muricomes intestini]HAX53160.1 L-asparaginase 1 [Lachnospiraceae bacterium]HCR85036.1 L-asparaginase 1 [Lachnospiraceae bacterium]